MKSLCEEWKPSATTLSPVSSTHSLWVLRLLQEGRELQHSQLGAGNTSTLPRGGTGRHWQPCCAFITCRHEGSDCVNLWFECDKEKALKAKCSDILAISLSSSSRAGLSRHFDSMTALCQHSGGKRTPTCYGGRAGRLHGVTLLGEGLNAGETRQTREGEACYAPSRPHDPISHTNWTGWPLKTQGAERCAESQTAEDFSL